MTKSTRFRPWQAAAFMAAVTAISAAASRRSDRPYYERLSKPEGSPPGWAFPAIWSGLNLLQAWADLRILNDRTNPDRNVLLGLRAMNWILYTLFVPAFFRARSPKLGEAVTLAEGVTAGATLALLARHDRLAAAALTPLTLWTGYAGLIGAGIAERNPDQLMDRLRRAGGL